MEHEPTGEMVESMLPNQELGISSRHFQFRLKSPDLVIIF